MDLKKKEIRKKLQDVTLVKEDNEQIKAHRAVQVWKVRCVTLESLAFVNFKEDVERNTF